jgi:plastocyanin
MRNPIGSASGTAFLLARLIFTGALALVVAGALAPSPRASTKRHQLSMQGMAFKPARLEVAVGDTVVWTNQDIVPHSATAGGAGAWDTGALAQGKSAVHVPALRGEVRYHCTLHPAMEGTLLVK